jgi:DNA-binding winged helix-turn-helix (wHTH) protein
MAPIDPVMLTLNGVRLSPMEWRLLSVLRMKPGYVYTMEEIEKVLWGEAAQYLTPDKGLRDLVMRLRRKGAPITNHWGIGYSYNEPASSYEAQISAADCRDLRDPFAGFASAEVGAS